MLQSLDVIPINGFSFPLVDFTFQLHRKRNNVVIISATVNGSDDLFPAHWAFGDAFSGLRALVFTSYQGFHETCMAEQVTLKGMILVFEGDSLEGTTYRSGSLSDLSCSPCR